MMIRMTNKIAGLLALAMTWAVAARATAAVVASYAGPESFATHHVVVLPDVSVGLEGTLSMDFIAPDITTRQFLWTATDAFGGSPPGEGEMALQIRNGRIGLSYWTLPQQVLNAGHTYESLPIPADGLKHHVEVTWKNGNPVVLKLDGAGLAAKIGGAAGGSLTSWTTLTGAHVLGGEPDGLGGIKFAYGGTVSNMVLKDVYSYVVGDVNFDGIVNGQDIALMASQYLVVATLPGLIAGDANMDGIVNGQDIALVASNWLQFPSPGSAEAAAVPEPGTFALLSLGLALGGCAAIRRRRNRC